jgi:GT2 family glycosyltransferase
MMEKGRKRGQDYCVRLRIYIYIYMYICMHIYTYTVCITESRTWGFYVTKAEQDG